MCDKDKTEKERNCNGNLTYPYTQLRRQEDQIRPSIVKGVSIPSKPRLGDAYQVKLPEPRVRD